MNNLSLSRRKAKVLPETVTAEDGKEYSIDADFRTVLRCVRVCTDPEVEAKDAIYMILMWFFKGVVVPSPMELFCAFISDETDDDGEPPKMDFEQDADAIYASFMMDYRVDLFEVDYLHWYKFRALLAGLSEGTALQERIRLRDLDTSGLKGKEKVRAERAKRKVALIERTTPEDDALCDELEKALADGRDPSEVLKKLKNR